MDIVELFDGLERASPGSEASTLRALDLCRLAARPVVADFGCGPGAAALTLARHLDTRVLAIDLAERFLDGLRRRARQEGLRERICTLRVDFGASGLNPGSLDLLWSEGAIYHLGWVEGLKKWAPLVRPGGYLVLSEISWLASPDPEPLRYWSQEYPKMAGVEQNLQAARELGLKVSGHFVAPASDWDNYYEPLRGRLALDPVWAANFNPEMEFYKRYGHQYGYVFYALERP